MFHLCCGFSDSWQHVDSCFREAIHSLGQDVCTTSHLQAQGHTEPGCAMLTLKLMRAEGASILLHAGRSRVQRVLHRWEGGKPSLRNVMDSQSRGSFCFKLTLNSIVQPLKFPRVALRSCERQTEKAYCLCIRGAVTALGCCSAFRGDIPSDGS